MPHNSCTSFVSLVTVTTGTITVVGLLASGTVRQHLLGSKWENGRGAYHQRGDQTIAPDALVFRYVLIRCALPPNRHDQLGIGSAASCLEAYS